MNKQQIHINKSGLPLAKVAELTGINYMKLYRVNRGERELKLSEYEKVTVLNRYINKIKEECAAE